VFEYFGEDPHHASRATAAAVRGMQSSGVVATVKHYIANNQEHERASVSAEVGERALRELYLPAFEAAVEADVGAVMSAYNRVNGTFASEHRTLQVDVLKEEFGFDGPVMSDWWAVEDGLAAARGGLDLEMPGVGPLDLVTMVDGRAAPIRRLEDAWPSFLPSPSDAVSAMLHRHATPRGMPRTTGSLFAPTLPAALDDGRLSTDRLDEMVRRVLTIHERVGALDGSGRAAAGDRAAPDGDPREHRDLAAEIAVSGTVLLKNEGALPLDPAGTVALVGPNIDEAKVGGGGSSEVTPVATVTPLEGLRERHGGRLRHERGHAPVANPSLFDPGTGLRAFLRDRREYDVGDAVAVTEGADTAVVVVQDGTTEGRDRDDLALPGEQDRLVAAVAAVADRTVVVLQTAGPVEMPWLDAVDAVVEAWYPGQEAGRALASVLYGDADPGGRLPITFAAAAGDYPANSRAQYPGVPGVEGHLEADYSEGVFVGYRHFDARDIEPLFPFGHGLSYTGFEYDDATVAAAASGGRVEVTVGNVGDRDGREVVQAYVEPPGSSAPRPPRELAGFEAVELAAGESQRVTVELDDRAFARYDEAGGEWVVDGGSYGIVVGRSSRDGRARATVHVGQPVPPST
jgi:beta-glucosidase